MILPRLSPLTNPSSSTAPSITIHATPSNKLSKTSSGGSGKGKRTKSASSIVKKEEEDEDQHEEEEEEEEEEGKEDLVGPPPTISEFELQRLETIRCGDHVFHCNCLYHCNCGIKLSLSRNIF